MWDPLERERVGMLTNFAVGHLWSVSPDAAPDCGARDDWYRGCCPRCCGPCSVIRELLDDDLLDDWLRGCPEQLDVFWWDDRNQEVDRAWLARAWADADELGCHEPEVSDEELAARHFDVEEAAGLRADGMPEDGVQHLRRKYVRDACASPAALEQLRAWAAHYAAATPNHEEPSTDA